MDNIDKKKEIAVSEKRKEGFTAEKRKEIVSLITGRLFGRRFLRGGGGLFVAFFRLGGTRVL